MKVAELSGATLDYWVSLANGNKAKISDDGTFAISRGSRYSPSIDWRFGGPIIEREHISFLACYSERQYVGQPYTGWFYSAAIPGQDNFMGKTHLEAAMRAYVASKFGETVADEVAA